MDANKVPDPADNFGGGATSIHRGLQGDIAQKRAFLLDWITRHPYCTLTSGEGKILVDWINELLAVINQYEEHQD